MSFQILVLLESRRWPDSTPPAPTSLMDQIRVEPIIVNLSSHLLHDWNYLIQSVIVASKQELDRCSTVFETAGQNRAFTKDLRLNLMTVSWADMSVNRTHVHSRNYLEVLKMMRSRRGIDHIVANISLTIELHDLRFARYDSTSRHSSQSELQERTKQRDPQELAQDALEIFQVCNEQRDPRELAKEAIEAPCDADRYSTLCL